MTLRIHRAPRTDLLADALGDLLVDPLPDPFAEDVVVVPAKGVERWLTQRLSHRLGTSTSGGDGVCAGVRFLNPSSLVSMLLGRDRDDPWDPDRLVWPLLSRDRRPPRRAVVRHAGDPSRPRPRGRRGTAAAQPPLLRRSPPRRPVRVVRRPAPEPGHRLARGPRPRRGRRSTRRRPRLAGRALAPVAGRRRRATARRPARPDSRAARGRGGRGRPARPAVTVRAHPAAGHRGRAAAGARPPPRRPPVAAAALDGAVGGPRRPGWSGAA